MSGCGHLSASYASLSENHGSGARRHDTLSCAGMKAARPVPAAVEACESEVPYQNAKDGREVAGSTETRNVYCPPRKGTGEERTPRLAAVEPMGQATDGIRGQRPDPLVRQRPDKFGDGAAPRRKEDEQENGKDQAGQGAVRRQDVRRGAGIGVHARRFNTHREGAVREISLGGRSGRLLGDGAALQPSWPGNYNKRRLAA